MERFEEVQAERFACIPAGTASYPATLFTNAPLQALQAAFAMVEASCSSITAASPPVAPLLALRDVTYSTADGTLCAFALGFEVAAGAAVLVEGRSGSGKSTLVRVLAGLHPMLTGSIEMLPPSQVRTGPAVFLGSMLAQSAQGVWQICEDEMLACMQVMFLPQRALTAPGGALWDQLTYGCSRPVSSADMKAALQCVGLHHLLDRAGGDWQRPVNWAGALCSS